MSRTQAAGKMRFVKGVPTRISAGRVDWEAVQQRMRDKGIELRGARPTRLRRSTSPLDGVLSHHSGTVEILHRLKPLGVAMAGADVTTRTRTDPCFGGAATWG